MALYWLDIYDRIYQAAPGSLRTWMEDNKPAISRAISAAIARKEGAQKEGAEKAKREIHESLSHWVVKHAAVVLDANREDHHLPGVRGEVNSPRATAYALLTGRYGLKHLFAGKAFARGNLDEQQAILDSLAAMVNQLQGAKDRAFGSVRSRTDAGRLLAEVYELVDTALTNLGTTNSYKYETYRRQLPQIEVKLQAVRAALDRTGAFYADPPEVREAIFNWFDTQERTLLGQLADRYRLTVDRAVKRSSVEREAVEIKDRLVKAGYSIGHDVPATVRSYLGALGRVRLELLEGWFNSPIASEYFREYLGTDPTTRLKLLVREEITKRAEEAAQIARDEAEAAAEAHAVEQTGYQEALTIGAVRGNIDVIKQCSAFVTPPKNQRWGLEPVFWHAGLSSSFRYTVATATDRIVHTGNGWLQATDGHRAHAVFYIAATNSRVNGIKDPDNVSVGIRPKAKIPLSIFLDHRAWTTGLPKYAAYYEAADFEGNEDAIRQDPPDLAHVISASTLLRPQLVPADMRFTRKDIAVPASLGRMVTETGDGRKKKGTPFMRITFNAGTLWKRPMFTAYPQPAVVAAKHALELPPGRVPFEVHVNALYWYEGIRALDQWKKTGAQTYICFNEHPLDPILLFAADENHVFAIHLLMPVRGD